MLKTMLPVSRIEADHAKIKPMKHVLVANDIILYIFKLKCSKFMHITIHIHIYYIIYISL